MKETIKSYFRFLKETWFGIEWLGDGGLWLYAKVKNNLLLGSTIIISVLIARWCVDVIGWNILSLKDITDIENIKYKTDILRNILLGLGALIGIPFLVWQNQTSHRSLQETKENNKKIQEYNSRTQETKIYIDCITQLAHDKETIRTAAVHGLHELIKNTKDDSLKEKIFNILWSFMVEHSKECVQMSDKIDNMKDETEKSNLKKEFNTTQNVIENFYSQFKIILEILAKYKDKNQSNWWKNKSMRVVWLHKINLAHAVLENACLQYTNLQNADLQNTNLRWANLQNANLRGVNLQNANLRGVNLYCSNLRNSELQNANLNGADLESSDLPDSNLTNVNLRFAHLKDTNLWNSKLQDANFKRAKYHSQKTVWGNPTQFPDDFDPKDHGMIDMSDENNHFNILSFHEVC